MESISSVNESRVSVLSRFSGERRSLLPLLTETQREAGFLSESAIRDISRHLDLTDNEVYGVASFYPWFRFAPSPEAELETAPDIPFGQTSSPGESVVVCNAARGEPHEVDHLLLETGPDALVERLAAEARRLGCGRAVIWVDVDWPEAAGRVIDAVQRLQADGIAFDVARVPGALMHREESAFRRAFEGLRPIAERLPCEAPVAVYSPAALVRLSASERGGEAFYAVSGSVAESGVVEVPEDATVRHLLERVGGVAPAGRTLKAFQAGGPLGSWLPPDRLDEPVDAVSASAWGSGSLLFANDRACAVELAARTLDFLSRHLCGKCAVCREGTMQMAEILRDITEGKGKAADLDLLLELGEGLATTGSCALGRAAPNALLSTIRIFPDEYGAHVRRKLCVAGRCSLEREG